MGLKTKFWGLFKQVVKKSYLHSYHIALSGVFLIGYSLVVLLLYSVFLFYSAMTISDVVAAFFEIVSISPYLTLGVVIFAVSSYYIDIVDYARENDLHFDSSVINFGVGLIILLVAIRWGAIVSELIQEVYIEYETLVFLIPTYSTLAEVVFSTVVVGFIVFSLGSAINGLSRMVLSLFDMKSVLLNFISWITSLPQRIPHYESIIRAFLIVKKEGGGSWWGFPKGVLRIFQRGLQTTELEVNDQESEDIDDSEEDEIEKKAAT